MEAPINKEKAYDVSDDSDSDDEEDAAPAVDPKVAAMKAKEEGNQLYKAKQYRDSIKRYSEAIRLDPDEPAFYNNRAAAHIMLLSYREALDDAKMAIARDGSNPKYHLRAAKGYAGMGKWSDATRACNKVLELEPGNAQAQREKQNLERIMQLKRSAETAMESRHFNNCVSLLGQALQLAPQSKELKLLQAEAEIKAGNTGDAERTCSAILREDKMHAEALYVRGVCMYHLGNLDQAQAHFRRALQSNPEHARSKKELKHVKKMLQAKEAGTAALKSGNLQEAMTLYTEALDIDPDCKLFNAKLYFNRAVVGTKLKQYEDAVSDCEKALDIDPDYVKARLKQGELLMKLERYEEAVKVYEEAVDRDASNHDLRAALKNAKLELKKSKRKNYYKILGVEKDASDSEIKKAYRKAALRCHPDRVSEEEKEGAEIKFKELGEAYAILSDDNKRRRYDAGEDIESLNENNGGGHGHGHGDMQDIFAQMFAQQGGFGGGGFGGGGGRGFGGGFPF